MMKPASQEYLNAFVDGELSAGELDEAMARLDGDPAFRQAVCEARALKEMVRGAYADSRCEPVSGAFRCPPVWRQALVATLLLGLGLAGGWLARGWMSSQGAADLAGLPLEYRPIALTDAVDADKVILHLDSSEPARLAAVLDLAERLLDRPGAATRVEVVVNSYGLDLLRQDTTPYRDRIERLSKRHAGLSFFACGQTVTRLQREGVEVRLLPVAGVANSAIGEILARMSRGWVYVKV